MAFKKEDKECDPDPRPCIWFIPGVNESGLTGCPYHVHGENDEDMINPACWIAVPYEKILELVEKNCYDSDIGISNDEQESNKDMIKRLIG